MLFADDSAIATHAHQELQSLMDHFLQVCKHFGLIISLKKTNILGQDTVAPPVINIGDHEFEVVHQFAYFGYTITNNLSLYTEISNRMRKASTTLVLFTPQADELDKDGRVQCL